MACYDGYIEIDDSTPSRTGLYAVDLPGVDIATLEGLTKEDQEDYTELHAMILKRAWLNLVTDVSIALQNKFLIDAKVVARETSKFKDSANGGSGKAGVKIEFSLPKYARLHIISISVFSQAAYESPDVNFYIYDEDENRELLYSDASVISEGRNTVNVDQDFEVDKVFVAYDAGDNSFRETENRYYNSLYINWDKLTCTFPCFGETGYQGTVTQVNGGGLNVKFNIVCSIEKYICENINLFKSALFYRYGVELMDEQLLGNRLNKYTTMTEERATERGGYFGAKYSANVGEATKSQNIIEDPYCFRCKNAVMSKTIIP